MEGDNSPEQFKPNPDVLSKAVDLTPERENQQTPNAFLQEVRKNILGENLDTQKAGIFNASVAGEAFKIADQFLYLQDKIGDKKFPGMITSEFRPSKNENMSRHIRLRVGNEFQIVIQENGIVRLQGPVGGGDDFLFYGRDNEGRLAPRIAEVTLDGKTGLIRSGETEISKASEDYLNLRRMLDATLIYYDSLEAVVQGEEYPEFPKERLQSIRGRK